MYDVAIIGGGVIGAMTAMLLSHYELTVCLLEKENDIAMGTTKANSAIVHAGFDARAGSLKAKLNVRGSAMMEGICKDLSVSYERNGALVIGFDESDCKKLEELYENGKQNGVRDLALLDRKQLLELEPNLSDEVSQGLYAPTSAIVCPYDLTLAAMGNAMDNGAELELNFEVSSIEILQEGYRILSAEGKSLEAKNVINAAGVYADKIAAMVGDCSFSIHPRKGEYLLLDKEQGNFVRHTIFTVPTKLGKGVLVSPTVDHNLILGPTAEDGTDKEDKTTTEQGLAAVKRGAKASVKNLNLSAVITSFSGLRAVGDTGDFVIKPSRKGFFNGAGIESPGLSASPAIAELLVSQLAEDGLVLKEKKNFIRTRTSYKHFSEWSSAEKNRVIKENPAFGNIICRCEQISEGEILHALRSHPKPRDLDGVKRRTRSQMGRCQGGFCSPQIVKILAEEMGVPLEAVSKSGSGSEILTGKTKEARGDA